MFHTPHFLTAGGSTPFMMTVDTTQAGSANDTFILPLNSGGAYSFDIDWGDGNTDTITVWNQGELEHVYSSSGTYQISVTGQMNSIYFNNGGDKEKVMSIDNWGTDPWKVMTLAFRGCVNMEHTYTDAPIFLSGADTNHMFRSCARFNGPVDNWDMSGVDRVDYMFMSCDTFNQPMNSWDTSGFQFWTSMMYGCVAFNQDVSNWDFSGTTAPTGIFEACTAFNQSLAAWDITGVTNFGNLLKNCGMSTANYDATLIGWEAGTHQAIASIDVTGLTYTLGGAADVARDNLVSGGWTITGDSGV